MRISDWSSYVCSSDLHGDKPTLSPQFVKLEAVALHRRKQQSDSDLAAPEREWLRRARHFEQLQFHGVTLITMCCEDGRKCRCGGVFADAEPQSTVSSESNRLDRALRSLQIADDPTRIDKEGPPDLGEAAAAA